MTAPEKRQFKMDDNLLYSVIKAQAGTPEKALMEAVMNCIDAGASRCEVALDENGYTVLDDGRGFTSRKEIEQFFETFGTPHNENDATYGKFRMGRGQLFAFSSTLWRSGIFSMEVDIKRDGLSYKLTENPKNPYKGCAIKGVFYEQLKPSEAIQLARDLGKMVAWAQIPVFINKRQANKLPTEANWTEETDDAYLLIKESGPLAVYNQGVLVCEYYAGRFGLSGTVVSKKPLEVNFARNDILLSECKAWKRIRVTLGKLSGIAVKKKPLEMTDAQKDMLAEKIIRGETRYQEYRSSYLLVDCKGRQRRVSDLENVRSLTVADAEYPQWTAEQIHDSQFAYVLSPKTLDRFNVKSAEELLGILDIRQWQSTKIKAVPFAPLAEHLLESGGGQVLSDPKKNPPSIKAALLALNLASDKMAHAINDIERNTDRNAVEFVRTRRVVAGKSDANHAWTDGATMIAVEERILQKLVSSWVTPTDVAALLLHEYCHTESNSRTHAHSPEFFERYHELSCTVVPMSVVSVVAPYIAKRLVAEFSKLGLKLPRSAVIELDSNAALGIGIGGDADEGQSIKEESSVILPQVIVSDDPSSDEFPAIPLSLSPLPELKKQPPEKQAEAKLSQQTQAGTKAKTKTRNGLDNLQSPADMAGEDDGPVQLSMF